MDWHPDKKANASKLYPTHGRKGKKMVGKPGKDELLREKNARYLDRWAEAFEARHNRPPTELEKRTVLMEGRVIKDYDRLRDAAVTRVVERKVDGADQLKDWVHGTEAAKKIDELMYGAQRAAEEARVQRNRARFDVRVACPIPLPVMERTRDGVAPKNLVCETFGITEPELESYLDAFFRND